MRIIAFISLVIFSNSCGFVSLENSNPNSEVPSASGVVTPTPSPSRELEEVIEDEVRLAWSTTIKTTQFDWTAVDLFIKPFGARKVGIFSELSKNAYKDFRKSGQSDGCLDMHYFRILAVVENRIGVEHLNGFSCGAISTSVWRYATFDINKNGEWAFPRPNAKPGYILMSKLESLREIFSDTEILEGLTSNQRLSEQLSTAVKKGNLRTWPKNLREFDRYFSRIDSEKFAGEFYFEADYLSRFVFHHVANERVAVWISLTPTSHAGQANQEHIEILLPIPPKLRESLLAADKGEQGFLMVSADEYVGTSYAQFEFGSHQYLK